MPMDRVLNPTVTPDEIAADTKWLAAQLVKRLGKTFTVVVVLKAAWMFAADLMRNLPPSVTVEFVSVSTYGASNAPERAATISMSSLGLGCVKGRDVVVVDTVFDSGATMREVMAHARAAGASSVTSCVLIWKFSGPPAGGYTGETPLRPDLFGRTRPAGSFLVGYGLDDKGESRGLPRICTLTETA